MRAGSGKIFCFNSAGGNDVAYFPALFRAFVAVSFQLHTFTGMGDGECGSLFSPGCSSVNGVLIVCLRPSAVSCISVPLTCLWASFDDHH